jgi:hypothetical protein
MYKKSLLLIPLLVVMVACNNTEPPGDDGTYYSFDTNTNPNSYRMINSPRPTISDDQDKIRAAVEDSTGLDPQWVSIVGNTANVHVNIPSNYSKEQKQKLENKLLDAITNAVPRYNIRLKLDE